MNHPAIRAKNIFLNAYSLVHAEKVWLWFRDESIPCFNGLLGGAGTYGKNRGFAAISPLGHTLSHEPV